MPARNVLLRVLFASLAIAALCGAAGILYGNQAAVWRITWTAIVTASASLLLLAATRHRDREQVRPAALAAVALIVAVSIVSIAAIWKLLGRGLDDNLWITALLLTLVGVPSIGFVRMLGNNQTLWAGRIALGLAAVELVLLMWNTWSPSGTWRSDKLEGVSGVLPLAGLLAVACIVGAGTGDRRHWRWAGVLAASAAFTLVTNEILLGIYRDPTHVTYYLFVTAAVIAHANVLLQCPLQRNQLWLRRVTLAASIGAGLGTCIALTGLEDSDFVERLAGAAGLVAGCGTIAVAILGRVNYRPGTPVSAIAEVTRIVVQCPICRKSQPLPLDGARCAECSLLIHIRLEEPRCAACGYSLLMLKTDKCPECGSAVDSPAATRSLAQAG